MLKKYILYMDGVAMIDELLGDRELIQEVWQIDRLGQ